MEICIVAVGKIKEKFYKEAADEYLKRLKKFTKVKVIEVKDEPIPSNLSPGDKQKILEAEGERIIRHIKDDTYVIALNISGEEISSEKLASRLQQLFLGGTSRLTFIVGGTLGLSSSVLLRSHWQLSLSKLTFPHQLARVILLEQIYRSFTIINREPYHR
ncbi:MAG TPA: 23S rRNA (pseudouridine(1915)-N(3))-methyltransferase RlmH [Peptococcaceae bacterium]|nr:MAG: Ribosomal RNA large subunit methyltransferase H [Clostridia bacterium 41_269]HBT19888.1 23S rRNA (pseudouridine(1915)-N(3))-methyltransferase RlmH [Peptococcaceae bacterium]